MARQLRKMTLSDSLSDVRLSFETSVENFKRKRALHCFTILDDGSKSFFERMLEVKKIKDFIFVTESEARERQIDLKHCSVLAGEVLEALAPANGKLIVDGTLGAGGHAKLILESMNAQTRLIGFDKDPVALKEAGEALKNYGGRAMMIRDDYKNIAHRLNEMKAGPVHGALLDLGVSSMQLDDPARGFSFREDGPLDMRMNPDSPLTAAKIVNGYSKQDLLDILWKYGEERFARKIVEQILRVRDQKKIETTLELAEIVKGAVPPAYRHGRIHPATRTFQALRMVVNEEQGALKEFFSHALDFLAEGGRIVIISFHSLEDRIAKQTFKEYQKNRLGKIITKKPVTPSESELKNNVRSRSAKLRIFEKF